MGWFENWEIEVFNWIEWNILLIGLKIGKFMFLIEWNMCVGLKNGIFNFVDLFYILVIK